MRTQSRQAWPNLHGVELVDPCGVNAVTRIYGYLIGDPVRARRAFSIEFYLGGFLVFAGPVCITLYVSTWRPFGAKKYVETAMTEYTDVAAVLFYVCAGAVLICAYCTLLPPSN